MCFRSSPRCMSRRKVRSNSCLISLYGVSTEDESPVGTIVTVVVALLGLGALGVGGFVLGIYYESPFISYGSWGILALVLATLVLQRFSKSREEQQ